MQPTSTSLVLAGPNRSYEVTGDIPGRRGMRFARQQGDLGFKKLVAVRTVRSDAAEMIHALVVDEARLRHANIVSTLDVLVDGAHLHVVTEHIEGPCLAELIRAKQALPPHVAAAILSDALLGLDHAHGVHDETMGLANMLHCDVSPENVLVGFDGLTRILDIGMPRKNDPSLPSYTAPETEEGRASARTADVYACGLLLGELLTGERFAGVPAPSLGGRGIPRGLQAVVACALSREPRSRYASAGDMARALADAVRLASRAEVIQSVRAVALGEAAVVSPLAVRRPALGERIAAASEALRGLRLDQVRDVAATLFSSLRRVVAQLSFSTRVLLGFSAVSVVVLMLMGKPAKARSEVTTAPAAASAPVASAEASLELDEPSSASPAPSAAPAPSPSVVTAPSPKSRKSGRAAEKPATARATTAALLH
jgi:serine/threonine-protein kinase